MLQDSLSKIKYLIVLAFLLVIPMQAKAGDGFNFDPIDQTDTGVDRLIYYYDTVGRETYIQVTNTSDEFVEIHVQAFEAEDNCRETNFNFCLTPGDTQIWNVEALPSTADLSESNGFISISVDESGCGFVNNALIGMFRILDDSGYEYRTNAASSEDFTAFSADYDVLNFNAVNGNNLSDVVGITYVDIDTDQVFASPLIGTLFGFIDDPQILIFDDFENPTSCSPTLFTCSNFPGVEINKGIDNSIPNSQGFTEICNTNKLDDDFIGTVDAGWLFLPFATYLCFEGDGDPTECPADPFFVGFLGLNNGDGTGSMDSWLSHSFGDIIIPTSTASTLTE
jgi:hypothetical protein